MAETSVLAVEAHRPFLFNMDAGIQSEASQQPVNSDDTAGVTLGSGGQLQIGGDEGNLFQPSDPDITSTDGCQRTTPLDSPAPTLSVTDSHPSMPSPSPELSGESTLPDAISQIDFSWTETPSTPTAFLTVPKSIDFPTDLPLTFISISFDTILSNPAQSAIPLTTLPPSARVPSSLILSTLFSSPSPSSQPRLGSTSDAFVSNSVTLLSNTISNSFSTSVVSHSISVSSTINRQPPSETVFAPPIPANLNVHPATFYVGISLGALVAVALVTALIAWGFRRKTRRRKRSAQTIVPWGRSDDYDDGALESGRNASEMHGDALAALNLGSREDLAHIQAWSSHRDRDVGEPKRAPTYSNASLYSSKPYGHPRHTLYADQGHGYPTMEYDSNPVSRNLPSHLVPDDIPGRAYQRENSLYARNVSLGMNHGYDDPRHTALWGKESVPERPPPRSMADRLRNTGKSPDDNSQERLPSPTGPTLGKEEFEQWSTSLKSSLVNAFNAVASNLGGTAPRLKDEDGLTAPPKRSIHRRKTIASNKEKGDSNGISRRGSVATTASKPWTLEEIADGAGVVHLHLPELDKLELASQRPQMHRLTLSFGDGDSISMADDGKAGSRLFKPRDPQIALFASSKPKRAFIRPETYFARQKSTETVNANTLSRATSIYSTHSGRSRVPSPKSSLQPKNHQDHEEVESVVIAPDTMSRLSSTDSSLMMFSAEGSLLGPRFLANAAASRALKERQKKVVDTQTAQSLLK